MFRLLYCAGNEKRHLSSVLWSAAGRTHGSGDPLHQEPKHMDSDEEHQRRTSQ